MSGGNGFPTGGGPGLRRPRVRPYPLAELPRLLQVQVDLSRALWRHLGPVLDAAAGATAAGWAALEEALGGQVALAAQEPYLFPESGAAARVQGGVALELELLGPVPRRAVLAVDEALGSAEKLQQLLRALLRGAPVRVGACYAPREVAGLLCQPGQMLLGLDLLLRWRGEPTWARLLVSADLRLAVPPPLSDKGLLRLWQRRGRLSDVPVVLRIEVGMGLLPGEEVAGLARSDVVLLDRFGPRPVVGGPVHLRLDRGAFPAHLDGSGVTVTGPFQLEGTSMTKDKLDPEDGEGSERLLREMPVQLTCEMGRITLTGREVLELRPGAVLPLGRPLAGPVDLCAGGRVIAHGELVDVEGEIGIRVTEVLD